MYLAAGPLRTSADTAILTMSSTTVNVVTLAGANISWRGGIVHGGVYCLRNLSGGITDNLLVEDAELRNAHEACLAPIGAFDGSDYLVGLTVRYCLIHHAGRYNAHTINVTGMTWEYNETHHGNERHIPAVRSGTGYPDDEGDLKFLGVSSFIYRYNYMHDTDGDLWLDTNMTNGLVEESVFERCHRLAVFNEDNDGVTIQRNYFEDNGTTDTSSTSSPQYWQAAAYMGNIDIARSNNTTVAYNDFLTTGAVVTAVPHHDIRLLWQAEGGTTGTNVNNNRFRRSTASIAFGGFITTYLSSADNISYQTSNNRFDANEYHVPAGQTGSSWWSIQSGAGGDQTLTEWRAGASLPFAPGSYYDPASTLTGDL